jgi:hypothetical protein
LRGYFDWVLHEGIASRGAFRQARCVVLVPHFKRHGGEKRGRDEPAWHK